VEAASGWAENSKSQSTNYKWFDKLTTLSRVEGQITMTRIKNLTCLDHSILVFGISLEIGVWSLRFLDNSILQGIISRDYILLGIAQPSFMQVFQKQMVLVNSRGWLLPIPREREYLAEFRRDLRA
jgi:hypothetical protein